MRIDVVTLFPEMFRGFLDGSLLGAAQKSGLLDIRLKNIRTILRDFIGSAEPEIIKN